MGDEVTESTHDLLPEPKIDEIPDLQSQMGEISDLQQETAEISDLQHETTEICVVQHETAEISDLQHETAEISDLQHHPAEMSDSQPHITEISDLPIKLISGNIDDKPSGIIDLTEVQVDDENDSHSTGKNVKLKGCQLIKSGHFDVDNVDSVYKNQCSSSDDKSKEPTCKVEFTHVETCEPVILDDDSSQGVPGVDSRENIVDLTLENPESFSRVTRILRDSNKYIEIDLDNVENSPETSEPPSKRIKISQPEDAGAVMLEIDSNDEENTVDQDNEGDAQKDNPRDVASVVIDLSKETPDAEETVVTNHDFSQMSVYRFKGTPKELTRAWSCFKNEDNSNYLKGCKWAPDGTCLMTNSEDSVIRVFNLPDQLYHEHGEDEILDALMPVLKMKEADTIYDYCWYPLMSSSNPESACLAVTSKDTPVHLFDAFTGDLQCSYRAYDHLDEIVAAHSISFDPIGNKLFCGFNKMIRVFDVTRPGRECQNRPTFAKVGQRGIISCLAHSPSEHGLYAAGSYSRSIALYEDKGRGEMVCMFEGQQGGVTQLMFSPDGTKLYSGGRKDNEVICWDMRNPGHILFTMIRNVQTNQRIYFDITSDGQFLVSGSHEGNVIVWDTTKAPVSPGAEMDPILEPTMMFQAHQDTVNGLSLHPTIPVIATASGQRHYASYHDDSEDEDTQDGDGREFDNTLKFWWMYPNNT